MVNFIAADRQWFKAEVGIGTDTLPLDMSICRHAILQPGVLVVPDLTQDDRFIGNPLIHIADGLRFTQAPFWRRLTAYRSARFAS